MFDRFKNLEWAKLAKGAAIAAAGAALTYAGQWASGQDFGILAPTVAAVLSVAVNFIRKLATAENLDTKIW